MTALTSLLQQLAGQPGIRTIVLAGRDGLVVEHISGARDDVDALAAYCANALLAAENLGAQTRRAALIGIVLEYGDTLLSVDPLGELAFTVARLDTAATLVPLRQSLRQLRYDLLTALDAV